MTLMVLLQVMKKKFWKQIGHDISWNNIMPIDGNTQ